MSTTNNVNVDQSEINRFEEMARHWWDTESEFRALHDINPARMTYIRERVDLADSQVLDVGCGGGILSESLAEAGARVTGIDVGTSPLTVARLHQIESGYEIDYRQTTIEALARESSETFDVITCLEMLEHVPDPDSIIEACHKLLKPDGSLFVSTINRNPQSYLLMVIGAEYMLGILPKGTHRYEKFITPAELASSLRRRQFQLQNLSGMRYNPLTRTCRLGNDVAVNYLVHATRN